MLPDDGASRQGSLVVPAVDLAAAAHAGRRMALGGVREHCGWAATRTQDPNSPSRASYADQSARLSNPKSIRTQSKANALFIA